MAWYKQGTISTTQNSDVVTGIGTEFLTKIRYGDILLVNNKLYEIAQALTDTAFKLTEPFPSAGLTGVSYAVIRNMTNSSNYDLIAKLEDFLVNRQNDLDEFDAWANGTEAGGPNGDGYYPLTDRFGVARLLQCPAKMAALAGTDYGTDVTQLQADVTALQTLLQDYPGTVLSINGDTGAVNITLETLGAQPENAKLDSISSLTLTTNQLLCTLSPTQFGAINISARGKSLLAASSQGEMQAVIGTSSGGSGGSAIGRRVAIIGTSLCQLSNYGTVDQLANTNRGWIYWAAVFLNGAICTPVWWDDGLYAGWEQGSNVGSPRYWRGLNAGVSSDNADNIAVRADYLINNVDADIVILDSGINDVARTDLTVDQIQTYREMAAEKLIAAGRTVIMLAIHSPTVVKYPVNHWARQNIHRINNRSRDFCAGKKNCFFFDWAGLMMDFVDYPGLSQAQYLVEDGLHFAPKGGFKVGKGLADFIAPLVPPAQPRVWSPIDLYSAENPFGNLLANPFVIGNAGTLDAGVTGTVSSYFRVGLGSGSGSAVASLVAREDGKGNWQQLTCTADSAADGVIWFRVSDFAHSLPAGAWVQASVEVEVDAWDGWHGVNLTVRDLSTGGLTVHALKPHDAGYDLPNESWKGTLITPALQVLSAGSLRWRVEISLVAGKAGAGVVRAGACELRQVESPQSIVNAR